MNVCLKNFGAETKPAIQYIKQAAFFSLAEIVQKVFANEHFSQLQYPESLM